MTQRYLMSKLNSPILTLVTLALFIALAVHSCEPKMASNEEASRFIAEQLAHYKHPKPMDKRLQIMSVWGLTESDVSKPVNIFASNGEVK